MKICDIAKIINNKIEGTILNNSHYISTENMIGNCGGVVDSSSVPTTKVTQFTQGDILLSNIRPYFKKVWFSVFDGGCSNDVICIRTTSDSCLAKYLYYALCTDKFIDTFSASSKGTKMPRGDKNALLSYEIPDRNIAEQQHIVDILGSIDDKIENNEKIIDALLKKLQLEYTKRFSFKEDKTVSLSHFVSTTIGGDWGKETAEKSFNEKVVCVRGADIPEIASGRNGTPPIRYILQKNRIAKELTDFEIIVEISGGSPTQSTGRCALITFDLIAQYDCPLICTNFCRALRCIDKKSAAYVYSAFSKMYDDNVFFNYENGTTGIKNLDLQSILDKELVYCPSDTELSDFYDFTNNIYSHISYLKNENNKLNELKQLYLKKFFG